MGEPDTPAISRRDLLAAAAGAAALPDEAAPARAARRASRPNIVLLLADQFRGDCIRADGNAAIHTPNLDRIAAEGVRFRCAYSSAPTCTPARSALLTGLSPWHHGMLGMTNMAERYPFEKPRALRDAGYYAMAVGKMHYYPERNGHRFHEMILDEASRAQSAGYRSDYISWFMTEAPNLKYDATGLDWNGFEAKAYVLPERLQPTHWTGETAVRFIDTYRSRDPFFLKVSFHRPHSPYDPPARFMRMYADRELPPAAVGDWAERYAPRSDNGRAVWHGDLGAEQVRRSRQGYYGSVSFVDEQVGRVLRALESRGWLHETLVVFTSDHGDMTGDHHLWRKSYAYEPSARVPLLMRWPAGLVSAKRGTVRSEPVELRDILPTFLDAAGAQAPDHLDGQSLLRLVRGGGPAWRDFIDLEHDICYAHENHWNALTDGRRKYIYHAFDGSEQLFDLEHDPRELTDLASRTEHAPELRRWRRRLVEHFAERGAPFLRSGELAPRPEGMMLSPRFPRTTGKTNA